MRLIRDVLDGFSPRSPDLVPSRYLKNREKLNLKFKFSTLISTPSSVMSLLWASFLKFLHGNYSWGSGIRLLLWMCGGCLLRGLGGRGCRMRLIRIWRNMGFGVGTKKTSTIDQKIFLTLIFFIFRKFTVLFLIFMYV